MAIRVTCPHCDTEFNVADDLRGKKVRCRECEKPVLVAAAKPRKAEDEEDEREERVQAKPRKPAPVAARSAAAERPARRPDKRRDEDDDDDDRDTPRKKQKKSSTPIVIGAIAGGVVAVGGIVLVLVLILNRDKEDTGQTVSKGPPTGFQGGAGGPPAGMMGQAGGPPPGAGGMGGMMGQGGGMMGKGGPNIGDMPDEADKAFILGGILHGKELDAGVSKKIEESTVHFTVKANEKDPFGAQGSGFLAFEPGIVLTNAHVVDMLEPGADVPGFIKVTVHSGTPNEKQLDGKVIGVDRKADLAVVRVDPAGLPPPLQVKSSTGLANTQVVYICGFPLGKSISNAVTILQGQVVSLNRDPKTKALEQVVLNSDMQHGNSGGPVVNNKGEVVGVSVAGIEGKRINFAVPGDYVNLIVKGRIARMRIGQSSRSQGHVKVPVTAELINPLGQLDKVAIEVWSGDDSPDPPASSRDTPPAAKPGDSKRERFELDLPSGGDKATGEFTLPELPSGKVCYWQPILTYKEKDKSPVVQWSVGEKYKRDLPVERRGTKLAYKRPVGNRSVSISVKENFSIVGYKTEASVLTMQCDVDINELLGPPDAQGKSTMRCAVNRFNAELKLPDEIVDDKKEKEKIDDEQRRVYNGSAHLDLSMLINERGDVEKSTAVAKTAPPDVKARVESLGDDILHWIQSVSVPLPNRQMTYLETWKAKHPFAVLTPVADMHFKDVEMTYTYLGQRIRDDREEALVEITGRIRKREMGQRFGGKLEGRALVDLQTSLVTQARATITMDFDLILGRRARLPSRGTMDVTIIRNLAGG